MVERQILDSWKEISAYLNRSEKTCRRLEIELGLPVHRLEDSPKARVFAYKDEIDLWIEKTQHSERKSFFAKSRLKKFLIPALAIIVLFIIGAVIWQIIPRYSEVDPLASRPSVAVISFENQTRDSTYDYLGKIIPNLLITNLEQSGKFNVTSWERLHDLLKQIGKEDVEVIDKDLGFELCQMDEVEAIVIGSFAKAGDMFLTDVKVLDVETKKILKSASSKGQGEESILRSQIDELSREILQGIGLSASRTDAPSIQITDVTTDSLDAYYYYVRGKESIEYGNQVEARKFLKKAVELDPSFAMAYLSLGATYYVGAPGGREGQVEYVKKAKKFSARATEKERLRIEGAYALYVERDREKRLRINSKMAKQYPKDKSVHYLLGTDYYMQGLLNQAIEEFKKALELDPNYKQALFYTAHSYGGLGNYEKKIENLKKYLSVSPGNASMAEEIAVAYFEWGKMDEALAKYSETLEIDPDLRIGWIYSYIHACNENYPDTIRWIDKAIERAYPGRNSFSLFVKSFYQYWLGSLDEAVSNLLNQIDSANKTGLTQHKANANWMMGWISFDRDELELCRKHFKTWFDIYMQDVLPERANSEAKKKHWTAWYYFYLGLVDVKQGKVESAGSRLEEINALLPEVLPEYKKWIEFYHNFLQAEIFLVEGAVDKTITLCEKSPPLGGPVLRGSLVLHNVPFLKDVLARAYIQYGEIDKAIAVYERLLVFDPQQEERFLIHPKYYYRLAKLYEQKGDKGKAIENFEKFLELWKNADPGIMEVEDARERLAGLVS